MTWIDRLAREEERKGSMLERLVREERGTFRPVLGGGHGAPAGGVAGQALVKNSGADYDYGWGVAAAKATDWGRASKAAAPGNAWDEEFIGGVINPAFVETKRPGKLNIFSQRYDRMTYRWREVGTVGDMHTLMKPHAFVPGDYIETATYTNRWNDSPSSNGIGLVFSSSSVWGAGLQVGLWAHSTRLMLVYGGAGFAIGAGWNNGGQQPPRTNNPQMNSGGLVYMQLIYEAANTWGAKLSTDGFEWVTIATGLGVVMAPAFGGLLYMNWDAVGPMAAWDEWRYLRLNPPLEAA